MAIQFLLDEHLRGPLWNALLRHNQLGTNPVDAVRVGDPPDLPLGTPDPAVLLWAEREGRILVSRDERTLPGHLTAHLAAGHHSPGILTVKDRARIRDVLDHLVLITYAGDPLDYQDQIKYIP